MSTVMKTVCLNNEAAKIEGRGIHPSQTESTIFFVAKEDINVVSVVGEVRTFPKKILKREAKRELSSLGFHSRDGALQTIHTGSVQAYFVPTTKVKRLRQKSEKINQEVEKVFSLLPGSGYIQAKNIQEVKRALEVIPSSKICRTGITIHGRKVEWPLPLSGLADQYLAKVAG